MQKTTVVDDFDRTTPANETIHFSIDGNNYEIDLSEANAREFWEVMGKYTAVAQKHTSATATGPARRSSGGSGADTKAIRAWAVENGISVPDRGRLRPEVVAQYNAANS
jgi:hypothetical protein